MLIKNSNHHPFSKDYRRGVRWSAVGAAGVAILQLGQTVIFARLAGPSAAGDYALAGAFMGFLLPLAEVGLSQAVVQARAVYPEQLRMLARINFGLGAVVFVLLAWAGPMLAGWYGRPALAGLLLLMSASLLVTPFGAMHGGLLVRAMRFEYIAQIEVLSWLGSSATVAGLAWAGWGAWAMAAGFLVRNVLATFLVRLFFNYSGLPPILPLPDPPESDPPGTPTAVSPLLRFGFYDLASRWADFLANYLDKLIVGKWLGAEALGYYNMAFTFLVLPTGRLGYIINRTAFPIYARLQGEHAQIQSFFERAGRDLVLLLFPVYMGLALFAREIVLLFFGENWLAAVPLFIAFGVAGLVRSMAAPFPELLKGLGRPRLLMVLMLALTVAFNVVLCLFLWKNPTPGAAAWSRVATKFVFEIGMLLWVAGRCGVDFVPTLRFAARLGLWLLPVGVASWWVGLLPGGFWALSGFKAVVFVGGLGIVAFFGPVKLRFPKF